MFVFLDFILFCFEGVLEAFYSVLLLLLFFLSYLKTVYKICIFPRYSFLYCNSCNTCLFSSN